MIEATGLSKRYGATLAVDDLSFVVPPGQVTGFLGPNGAGKSTTMRLILGLDAPTSGSVTVNGRPYASYHRPLLEVGALLEARTFHGGRSAYNHLLCLALSNGIGRARVDQVLELGDPPVLMFDEPVNGLDPEGVLWIRNLLRSLAAQGRTVFLSSHLMSEMSLIADRLIIIGRGRLIAQTTIEDLLENGSDNFVRVRSPQGDALAKLLQAQGAAVVRQTDGTLRITGATTEAVGELARANGFTLQELSAQQASLEDRYMELTRDSADYRTADGRFVPGRR